ncbi:hypothetical protein E4U21_004945 [Claviceps maximensis]|nr:hypothetical protein E4U21_004945 [Claviceps maximensis]
MRSVHMFGLAGSLLASVAAAAAATNPQDQNILDRDVVILGGGATGMYAAVQLTKQGHSVVLVEKKDILGGHAETLYLPDDAGHVDYGVEGYFNNGLTKDLFDLLGVDYQALLPATFNTQHVNFRTGAKVPGNSNILGILSGAVIYRAAIQKFDYLAKGIYNLPDPVPEELLRPFHEFVEKYHLHGALAVIFMFAENVGDLLNTPLLYVIQNFGIPHIDALLHGGYIRPRNGTYELFRKAAAYIGEETNILYGTTVSHATRGNDPGQGVQLTVTNARSGKTTDIRAKKLLITYPPTVDSMKNFTLQDQESSLFSKWGTNAYYAAAITNTGLPNVNVANVDPANLPGNLPLPPFQWQLEYSGVPGYFMTKIVGHANFTAEDAQDLIRADLKRMRDAGTFQTNDPDIVAFTSHSPETLAVSVQDVRDGFYRKLYDLQGLQNTYYTGYTFCTDYSSVLWDYTDSVLDLMHLS